MREGTEIFVADMGSEIEDMTLAKAAGEILETAYPGYLWIVSKHKCDITVQCGQMMKFGPYGFMQCLNKFATWSEFKAGMLRGGGELLERCELPWRWDGRAPKLMDGADPKHRRAFDNGDPITIQ